MKTTLKVLVNMFVLVFEAWVCQKIWGWYAVPFGFCVLPTPFWFGANLIFNIFKGIKNGIKLQLLIESTEKKMDDSMKKAWELLDISGDLMNVLVALLFAWGFKTYFF